VYSNYGKECGHMYSVAYSTHLHARKQGATLVTLVMPL
jgi:hypothetical protein